MGQEKKISTPKYKHLAPGKIRKVLLPLNGTRWLQRKGNKIRTWRDVFHVCVLPIFIFRRQGLCRNTEKSRRDSFLTETYINIYGIYVFGINISKFHKNMIIGLREGNAEAGMGGRSWRWTFHSLTFCILLVLGVLQKS